MKKLSDDLLEDDTAPEFHEALMKKTLRAAHQRKQIRRLKFSVGTAALVVAISFPFWKPREPMIVPHQTRQSNLTVVRSKSLTLAQVVSTTSNPVKIVASSDSNLTPVETRTYERRYAEIDDQQLFALLAGKPVALMRHGPNETELIFLNPDDQKEFLTR